MDKKDADIRMLVRQVGITPVRTQGIRDDIAQMLPEIENAYKKCKEYTDEWKFEIRPSLYKENSVLGQEIASLSYIAQTSLLRLKEVYAILLAGLGE